MAPAIKGYGPAFPAPLFSLPLVFGGGDRQNNWPCGWRTSISHHLKLFSFLLTPLQKPTSNGFQPWCHFVLRSDGRQRLRPGPGAHVGATRAELAVPAGLHGGLSLVAEMPGRVWGSGAGMPPRNHPLSSPMGYFEGTIV